ncbi:MAG: 30S ribosomal protein S20 [Candidatus Omnitrophica bacterium]|nr:30S ribosomal protein S20 [Candidatus Omnitrophota bacterium]
MPIKRAAYKQIRADKKKAFKNISAISAIKTMTKKLNDLISSKNKDKLEPALRSFISLLDKAAQKGIIRRRTASRKIARMSKKVSRILKGS